MSPPPIVQQAGAGLSLAHGRWGARSDHRGDLDVRESVLLANDATPPTEIQLEITGAADRWPRVRPHLRGAHGRDLRGVAGHHANRRLRLIGPLWLAPQDYGL